MRIKGLLEMMFEVLSDWIDAFIEDIEEVEAGETGGNTTPKGSISPRDSRGEPECGFTKQQLQPVLMCACCWCQRPKVALGANVARAC